MSLDERKRNYLLKTRLSERFLSDVTGPEPCALSFLEDVRRVDMRAVKGEHRLRFRSQSGIVVSGGRTTSISPPMLLVSCGKNVIRLFIFNELDSVLVLGV